jgi:hypothetical protein
MTSKNKKYDRAFAQHYTAYRAKPREEIYEMTNKNLEHEYGLGWSDGHFYKHAKNVFESAALYEIEENGVVIGEKKLFDTIYEAAVDERAEFVQDFQIAVEVSVVPIGKPRRVRTSKCHICQEDASDFQNHDAKYCVEDNCKIEGPFHVVCNDCRTQLEEEYEEKMKTQLN